MFHIVVPYYNAQNYISACIASIKAQTIESWYCYLIDDASTDHSSWLAYNAIANDKRFRLLTPIVNKRKRYVPGNYWELLHGKRKIQGNLSPERAAINIPDDDIIVCVDGDDRLSDSGVLTRLTAAYDDQTWLTWGSYNEIKANDGTDGWVRVRRGVSNSVTDVTRVRELPWRTSHLRTFRAFLFRAIEEKDLRAPNGNYWEASGDLAMMFPMLEMAGNDHAKFLYAINYLYTADNPGSDHNVRRALQLEYEQRLRAMPSYPLLQR